MLVILSTTIILVISVLASFVMTAALTYLTSLTSYRLISRLELVAIEFAEAILKSLSS
jgi:hypothetical protein